MVQWVKALTTNPDDLIEFSPRGPTWQNERTESCTLSSNFCMHAMVCADLANTINLNNKKTKKYKCSQFQNLFVLYLRN